MAGPSSTHSGWWYDIPNSELEIILRGTPELTLTSTALSPTTSDGNALGTSTLMWGDLFLASGSVINFNNSDVTLTHTSNTLTIGGGNVVISDGLVLINETTNANMTTGLTINQGTADDEIFALKSSTDIAHGLTNVAETDTFLEIKKADATAGGAEFFGLVENSSATPGLRFYVFSTGDTTRSTSGRGAIEIAAALSSGTGGGTFTTNGAILAVRQNANTRFILDAEGDSHQDVGTAWTNYDNFDDLALLTDFRMSVTRADDPIREGFDSYLLHNRAVMEGAKLVTFNDDGHHFVNMSRLTMLHTSAFVQVSRRLGELETRSSTSEEHLQAVEEANNILRSQLQTAGVLPSV